MLIDAILDNGRFFLNRWKIVDTQRNNSKTEKCTELDVVLDTKQIEVQVARHESQQQQKRVMHVLVRNAFL